MLPPDSSRGQAARVRRWQHASWRQVVETVNAQLTDVCGLSVPSARSAWGLLTRVAAKIAALIWASG